MQHFDVVQQYVFISSIFFPRRSIDTYSASFICLQPMRNCIYMVAYQLGCAHTCTRRHRSYIIYYDHQLMRLNSWSIHACVSGIPHTTARYGAAAPPPASAAVTTIWYLTPPLSGCWSTRDTPAYVSLLFRFRLYTSTANRPSSGTRGSAGMSATGVCLNSDSDADAATAAAARTMRTAARDFIVIR